MYLNFFYHIERKKHMTNFQLNLNFQLKLSQILIQKSTSFMFIIKTSQNRSQKKSMADPSSPSSIAHHTPLTISASHSWARSCGWWSARCCPCGIRQWPSRRRGWGSSGGTPGCTPLSSGGGTLPRSPPHPRTPSPGHLPDRESLTDWIDLITDWLNDWLTDWLADWLATWLTK